MRERGVSFKTALNDVLRSGLNGSTPPVRPYRINARPMGVRKGIDLTHALRLAGELEDAEIVRKLELHK